MKHYLKLGTLVAITLLVASCGNQSSKSSANPADSIAINQETERIENEKVERQKEEDLTLIKTLELVYFADRINIYNSMNAIAGVEGNVDWNVSYPDEYKDKPNLCIVEGTATGKKDGKARVFYLKLLLNKQTGRFEVKQATDDGKKLEGMEVMMILALEGGWKAGGSE